MSILCSMVGATFGVAAAAEVIRKKQSVIAIANAQIDTAQSYFGGSSAYFDGVQDRLHIATNDGIFFTGDFTIEMWMRSGNETGMIFGNVATNVSPAAGQVICYYSPSPQRLEIYFNGQTALTTNTTIAINTWYHIAMVRSGSTVKVYVNGTEQSSTKTVTGDIGTSTYPTWYIGGLTNDADCMLGHLDEIRFSKSARYTTGFTPSTTPFVNDDNTVLLIHADGTDGSTFFEDDNGVRASRSLIAIGNAQIDTAQSQFGGSSYQGDGTGDSILADNLASGITGDFTFECWVRFNALPSSGAFMMLATGDGNRYFGLLNNAGTQRWESSVMNASANQYVARYTPTITTGVWYHIALVKSGSTLTLYHNGTSQTATTIAGSMTSTSTLFTSSTNILGAYTSNNYSLNGWMDEVRISNTARYTANFTPATEPFVNDSNTLLLMHCDGTDASTVFRDDNGLIPATYTSDAVAFDGTDDFYSVSGLTTTAADSKFLTMAFTWFHNSGGNSRNQHFMTCRLGTTSGENGWEVCIQSGRFRYSSFDNSGASTDMVYGDFSGPTENAWNQIVAYVDHNNFANCKYFLNGVDRTSSLLNGASVGAVNLANNNINWGSSNVSIRIGEQDSTAGYNSGFSDFLGRISQIYVHNASGAPSISDYWDHSTGRPKDLGTKGTATGLAQPLIYHYGGTSTFPTNNGTGFNSYTLTANGGVTTNAANTIYARARRQRSIFANGNAQISTAQSQFGGSSALFDGTGDFITVANHPSFNFRQNDFTIEGWVRANNFTGSPSIIGMATVSGSDGWNLQFGGDGRLYFECGLNGANPEVQLNTNAAFSTNTWGHFAFVRSGNTLTAYVNGSASGQISFTGSINPSTANMVIGDGYGLATVWSTAPDFNGYLDEIRISNTARYTAGFTVTTTPFQNDANTVLLLHMDGNNASTVFFDDNGRDTTPT